ncbi:uncharacterized protein J4E79_002123 [Alternaria viburni]|uniref:uncharacterized protein n=1 Tax=Alternaria viburni TaxID=566460 RepID=UPI0020C39E69|nr:uncharacterized protein J4E79_002123 [Alternaria viburni]KAI4667436.1 hypothetical protein J4E79_002123 [Alternaria viburni]
MAENPRIQIVDAVQRQVPQARVCFTSGEYTDLTIKCGADIHRVHKIIVCKQVAFFTGALKFGGKVCMVDSRGLERTGSDDKQEAHTDVIDLPEDEPKVIASLIEYLYTGRYKADSSTTPRNEHTSPITPSNIEIHRSEAWDAKSDPYTYDFPHTCTEKCDEWTTLCPHHRCELDNCGLACKAFICDECCFVGRLGGPQLLKHSKMYAIADKYDVTGLKELAVKYFNVARYGFWDVESFALAIDHVFSSTLPEDTGLRSIVIDTISDNMVLMHKAEIQAMVAAHSDLAVGVLMTKIC